VELRDFIRACIQDRDRKILEMNPSAALDIDEEVIIDIAEYYDESLEHGDAPPEWISASSFALLYDFLSYRKIVSEMDREAEEAKEAIEIDPDPERTARLRQIRETQWVSASDPSADEVMSRWAREERENCTHGDGCPVHPNIHAVHGPGGSLMDPHVDITQIDPTRVEGI
jgi:hypothetical protein